jgi:hypothetical protein
MLTSQTETYALTDPAFLEDPYVRLTSCMRQPASVQLQPPGALRLSRGKACWKTPMQTSYHANIADIRAKLGKRDELGVLGVNGPRTFAFNQRGEASHAPEGSATRFRA